MPITLTLLFLNNVLQFNVLGCFTSLIIPLNFQFCPMSSMLWRIPSIHMKPIPARQYYLWAQSIYHSWLGILPTLKLICHNFFPCQCNDVKGHKNSSKHLWNSLISRIVSVIWLHYIVWSYVKKIQSSQHRELKHETFLLNFFDSFLTFLTLRPETGYF